MIDYLLQSRNDAAVSVLSSVQGSTVRVLAEDSRKGRGERRVFVSQPVAVDASDSALFAAIAGCCATARRAFVPRGTVDHQGGISPREGRKP